MKKKFIPVVALASLLAMTGLAACGEQNPDNPSSETPTSSASGDVSNGGTDVSENVSEAPSTPEVIHVESIALTLADTTLKVDETTTASVSVLPENADDKTFTIISLAPEVASVEGNVIKALSAGTAEIKATSNDGAKTSSVTLTVLEKEKGDPTIVNKGEAVYTIDAGADLTLPSIVATSGDGKTDISDAIEVEDYNDPASLSPDGKTFNSKIAGKHTLSFYIEEDGKDAELTLEINVTPAKANTFEVADSEKSPSAITDYGTYKDGFEDGIDSLMYKGLGDANDATELSATADAIEGNSLIIDLNKTAGSALNAVFLNVFNSALVRNKAVTYTVEFDYKPLTESAYSGVYFGMRWDEMDGLNNQFIADRTAGNVQHYKVTFPETTVPEGKNAGFFFFKLSADSTACKIAIDNFSLTTTRAAETTIVTPTSDQLEEEGGFTFNWKDKANTFQKTETTVVENIEDETIRSAIKGAEGFGENVMHMTGRDDHNFAGLNGTNLVAGKKITISFKYYAVDDGGFNMITMTSAGNNTDNSFTMTEVNGKVKQFVYSSTIPTGISSYNFYPTNANFNIYIGAMNVLVEDADPVPEDQTAKGNKVGDSWTQTSRAFGSGAAAGGAIQITNDFATPEGVSGEGIGATVTKFAFSESAANCTGEWYNSSGNQMEVGHKYKIEVVYFIESIPEGSRFMINFDNQEFLNLPNGIGYHKHEIEWTATRDVNFFSFYGPETMANAVVYVASTTVTLTQINK